VIYRCVAGSSFAQIIAQSALKINLRQRWTVRLRKQHWFGDTSEIF
jgi:hypothetical protein